MKKINKTNKLLLNKETVRNLDEQKMHAVAGAASTDGALSAGPSLPGPSRDTEGVAINYNIGYIAYHY